MGVNNSVNIRQMVKKSEEISQRAIKIEYRIQDVFWDIKKLQTYWRGQAYADFARSFNTLDDNFSRILKYFSLTLPEEIIRKAKIYARAQSEKLPRTPGFGGNIAKGLKNVPIIDQGDTLIFQEDKVREIQDTIEKRFKNVENDLVRLGELFDQIPWTGTAKVTSTKIFKNNVNETMMLMRKVNNSLSQNIQAAINANKKAETGNASSAEKPNVSSVDGIIKDAEQRAGDLNSGNYDHTKETL